MRLTFRHILTLILIFLLLTGSFQRFASENYDRNSRTDLIAVVLSAKSFSTSVQDINNFKQKLGKMMTELYTAAGLKTVIRTDDKSANTISMSDIFFLISIFALFLNFKFSKISDKGVFYRTRNIEPPVPVP